MKNPQSRHSLGLRIFVTNARHQFAIGLGYDG